MSWSIGFDSRYNRDIGYGVPAYCDYPGCKVEIDRGLSYVCGEEPYGGKEGCGLYFCEDHLVMNDNDKLVCKRCDAGKPRFELSLEHPDWVKWKLTHESWAEWREEHKQEVERLKKEYNL